MARIAGVNIPTNKHVGIALTHIFGIGRNRALTTCKAAGVERDPQVKDLTEPEITRLRDVIAKFPVEGDLRRERRDEHQATHGSRLLPRHPASPRLAAARPAHEDQCAHAQRPAPPVRKSRKF